MKTQKVAQRLRFLAFYTIKLFPQFEAEEVVFTSQSLWNANDAEPYETIRAEYERQYRELIAALNLEWGEPDFEGHWEDDDFPDWAQLEYAPLTCWDFDYYVAYIALRQHDKELPLQIVIGTPRE